MHELKVLLINFLCFCVVVIFAVLAAIIIAVVIALVLCVRRRKLQCGGYEVGNFREKSSEFVNIASDEYPAHLQPRSNVSNLFVTYYTVLYSF